jgi:beta-N-acetylhexosaminidase
LTEPPLVLELRPPASIAAGEAIHGLTDLLDGAETVALDAAPRDAAALVGEREGRSVVVVRDAHRHRWERDTVEAVLAAAPDSVVVELGIPVWRPAGASAYIAAHGGGRANLAAVAEKLSGR